MKNSGQPIGTRELKGWHVLSVLIVFFGVTIGVNMILITQALTSFTGEDQKKSYLQGLRYNEVLAQRAAQRALGWSAEISRETRAPGVHVFTAHFTDKAAQNIEGLTVTGQLRRPVQAALDRPLTFKALGQGLYRAEVHDVASGQWRLDFDAMRASDAAQAAPFHAEKTLWLP